MRKIRRTVGGGALLGLLGGLLLTSTAIAQSASTSASSKPAVFVEGTINDIKTVNPWKALETPEYEVMGMNYDMLLNFDKATLQASPGLATEVPSVDNGGESADGMTWTFHIRSDATWQDGQPVTAKDIAWTFNEVLKDHWGNALLYLPFTDSITAPNDTTLIWKTTKPTTAPIRPPWIYIMPEHVYGSWTKDQWNKWPGFVDGQPPIGSGPFQLTQWIQGESWTMTANDNYWGGAPHIDQFVVKKYNNAEAMVSALKSGEIDYIGGASSVPPDLFDSLKNAPGIATNVAVPTGFDNLVFNMCDPTAPDAAAYCAKTGSTGNPAILDPQVRLAIAYAIDRNVLVQNVLNGYGVPGTSIVPPLSQTYHWDPSADQAVTFDIQKANSILDQAGYKMGSDGIRVDKNGDPLDFRLILRSESDTGTKNGKYIVGWLKQIGIKVTPVVLTDGKLISAWYANDYDMYAWGWGPDPDPDFILSTFTSAQCGDWSDSCYSNPTYDKLYTEQATATTIETRKPIVDQMQQILYQDNPEIVLYYNNTLEAYRSDRWTGLENNKSPQPDGALWAQYTPYTALTITPLGTGGSSATSTGVSAGVWLAIIAAIIVVAIIVVVVRRRGPREEEA